MGYVLLSPVLLQTNVVNVSESKLSSVSKASKASVFVAWYHLWVSPMVLPSNFPNINKPKVVFTQAMKHYMFVAIASGGDLKRWENFY
jgi:hypothetical protein